MNDGDDEDDGDGGGRVSEVTGLGNPNAGVRRISQAGAAKAVKLKPWCTVRHVSL